MNSGLESVLDSRSTVTALAVAPGNPSTLYLATSGRGVYKYFPTAFETGAGGARVIGMDVIRKQPAGEVLPPDPRGSQATRNRSD